MRQIWELPETQRLRRLERFDLEERIVDDAVHSVYLFQVGMKGPVKIGKARSLENRMKALQTANPYKLRQVERFPCFSERQAYALEQHLHQKMRRYRIHGEWFRPEVLGAIGKQVQYFFTRRAYKKWKRSRKDGHCPN